MQFRDGTPRMPLISPRMPTLSICLTHVSGQESRGRNHQAPSPVIRIYNTCCYPIATDFRRSTVN